MKTLSAWIRDWWWRRQAGRAARRRLYRAWQESAGMQAHPDGIESRRW